jgi:hypothetical protein
MPTIFLLPKKLTVIGCVLQTRDPDLESGDDLEETDREYCQVLLPSIAFIVNYLHILLATFTECDNYFDVSTDINVDNGGIVRLYGWSLRSQCIRRVRAM